MLLNKIPYSTLFIYHKHSWNLTLLFFINHLFARHSSCQIKYNIYSISLSLFLSLSISRKKVIMVLFTSDIIYSLYIFTFFRRIAYVIYRMALKRTLKWSQLLVSSSFSYWDNRLLMISINSNSYICIFMPWYDFVCT